jgi:hypothetical protein
VTDRSDNPRPEEPDHGLDVDAAFADIVAHWDDNPAPDPEPVSPEPDRSESLRELLTPAWPDRDDPPVTAWAEEEHFVPPAPPPVPRPAPGRLLAWVALFGTPVLALVLLVAHVAIPRWGTVGLVAAFVGGFAYLVATMNAEPPDHWSGDDGARL